MPGRVDVYRVVYAGNGPEGDKNYTALVFKDPVEGTVFRQGEMFGLPGAFVCPANEQGEIPQIEEGQKGVSWSYQK
jgi:hypothetical protein